MQVVRKAGGCAQRAFKLGRVHDPGQFADASVSYTHLDVYKRQLLEQGFIEIDSTSTPAAAAKPAVAPSTTPSFEAVRRSMVRALNDTIGPAAETLALRMERTKSIEELRLLLPMAVQTITQMRGRPAAEAFAARFDAL